MCKKVTLITRLLNHRDKFSAILVNDAKVVSGKLDAIIHILLLLVDETGI